MPLMDIKINGQVIGEVDPAELTIGDELDLEDAKSLRDLLDWLVEHAHSDPDLLDDVLRPLKLPEILEIGQGISEALGAAIPKTNAARSQRPSHRKTPRGRPRG